MLTVGVLGPVEARLDGVPLAVPAGKTTELLARLALDVGRPVRVDTLVEDLWGEPTARNTLQSKVSQLRRTIGKELVVGVGDGYRLALPADAVDATELMALATTSASAAAAGDPATALAAARAGLALFRGDVLPELGDWAAPHRARLDEVRLTLLERVVAGRVDLGAGGEIVAELEALVEEHPLREGLWATLITALYRAGRQADALAAYRRVRRLLDDELGVEPGPRLRTLERQVLRQSPGLVSGGVRGATLPGNLPPPSGPMIGRDDDLAEVLSALAGGRLVTILGPGGVGKTRLALEVAHRLDPPPGGVWLVRLDGVDPSADLADVVAETLRVVGGASALLRPARGCRLRPRPGQLRAPGGPGGRPGRGAAHGGTAARRAGHESGAAGSGRGAPVRAGAAGATGVRGAVRATRTAAASRARAGRRCEGRDRGDLPLPRRAPAGDRARRRAHPVAVHPRHRPASRRPVRPAPRSEQLSAGAAPRAGGRHRLELRPAVPRRPAGAVGVVLLRRQRLSRRCRAGARPRSTCRRRPSSTRSAAWWIDHWCWSRRPGAGELRYRLLDSIRLYAADRLRDSGRAPAAFAAHADWFAAAGEVVRGTHPQ